MQTQTQMSLLIGQLLFLSIKKPLSLHEMIRFELPLYYNADFILRAHQQICQNKSYILIITANAKLCIDFSAC